MKKLIIVFLACLVGSTTLAQDKDHNGFMKGDRFASGLLGYKTSSDANKTKETEFRFSPRIGYFINDFVAVGGRLGYSYGKTKDASGVKTLENNSFTAGVFGRYYLLPGSQFSVFGELGLGFGSTKDMNDKWTHGVNAMFAPGLSYFLGKYFALEASFGILSYNTVSPHGKPGSTHSFDVGIDLENINFGIIYKF